MSPFSLPLPGQTPSQWPSVPLKSFTLPPTHWMKNGTIEQWFGQDAKTGQIVLHQAKHTADSFQPLADAKNWLTNSFMTHADKFKLAVDQNVIDPDKAHLPPSLLKHIMNRADAKTVLLDPLQNVSPTSKLLENVPSQLNNPVSEHGLTWLSHHWHDPAMLIGGLAGATVVGAAAWLLKPHDADTRYKA
jgi:hypothetical protein